MGWVGVVTCYVRLTLPCQYTQMNIIGVMVTQRENGHLPAALSILATNTREDCIQNRLIKELILSSMQAAYVSCVRN